MDFTYTPEQEQFRGEIRGWLAANLTDDLRIEDPTDERVAPDRETFERRRAWQRRMFAAGWVGISWPKAYGGRGATLMEQVIYDEECFRARAPVLPGYSGIGMAGPTIIEWGTEAQKQRYLPRILGGDDIWCQGYSEPGAGSDLAGLRTRAEERGDHFVVNGQKVWTSGAQFADWIYLLVRTDPSAPKHRGISYLLVDMTTPGITVRPLVLLNGHRHFNEVFFVDVPVPKANLVGPLNEGWKVAITTLMFERSGAGGRDHAAQIARLAELAKQFPTRQEPAWRESHIRQQLAQHGLISGRWPLGIPGRAVPIIVCTIPVGHPFPDVPRHVIGAIGTLPALIAPNGRRITIAIIGCTVFPSVFAVRITKIGPPPVELIPPWVGLSIRAARGFFPFRLGGQAFPSPRAIRARVLLADLHDWMLLQPRNAAAWTPRHTPGGPVDRLSLFPRGDIAPALALGLRAVPCGLHKLLEARVDDLICVDVEGVQVHLVPGDFIPIDLPASLHAVQLVPIAAHAELPGWHQHHRRPVVAHHQGRRRLRLRRREPHRDLRTVGGARRRW